MSYWPKSYDPYPSIFLHIPKTAGLSVQKWFRSRYGKVHKCMHGGWDNPSVREQLETIPSFTVIRNPWDLVYSWYRYKRQMLTEPKHADHQELQVWEQGFEPWMEKYFTKVNYSVDKLNGGLNPISPSFTHLKYMGGSKDNISVIVRFENIKSDWTNVQNMVWHWEDLPHVNQAKYPKEKLKKVYTENTIAMVERAFEEDLKVWDWDKP